jgi:hypothetical protein
VAAAAAAPPSLESPPASPEVTGQQAGPSAQFIQGQGPGGQGSSASALALQKLNQVASDLKEVAKVLVQAKPNLVPLLQRSLQALSMLTNELMQGQQQMGQPGMQRQAPAPPDQGQEGSEEGAPPPSM